MSTTCPVPLGIMGLSSELTIITSSLLLVLVSSSLSKSGFRITSWLITSTIFFDPFDPVPGIVTAFALAAAGIMVGSDITDEIIGLSWFTVSTAFFSADLVSMGSSLVSSKNLALSCELSTSYELFELLLDDILNGDGSIALFMAGIRGPCCLRLYGRAVPSWTFLFAPPMTPTVVIRFFAMFCIFGCRGLFCSVTGRVVVLPYGPIVPLVAPLAPRG